MSYYDYFLDANLYNNESVAHFISSLSKKEINKESNFELSRLKENIPSAEDIDKIKCRFAERSKSTIRDTGTLMPEFIAVASKQTHLSSDVPTNKHQTNQLLFAGKALAFITGAHCTFFCTMSPIHDESPTYGRNMEFDNQWGAIVIGNSLRGRRFVSLFQINENKNQFDFMPLQEQASKDKFLYPYSDFYHIKDEIEMSNIVTQIPKLIKIIPELSEDSCLINFSTTLKALNFFNRNN